MRNIKIVTLQILQW